MKKNIPIFVLLFILINVKLGFTQEKALQINDSVIYDANVALTVRQQLEKENSILSELTLSTSNLNAVVSALTYKFKKEKITIQLFTRKKQNKIQTEIDAELLAFIMKYYIHLNESKYEIEPTEFLITKQSNSLALANRLCNFKKTPFRK